MRPKRQLLRASTLLLAFCTIVQIASAAVPQLQMLNSGWKLARVPDVGQTGTQISQSSFNDSAWIPAVVPGTVLTSYEKAGLVADPYFGINMPMYDRQNATPGVDGTGYYNTNYWYRGAFTVPASYSSQKIWLNFDGINWKAEIYANGTLVGYINGPFIRGKFDVSSTLIPGTTNYLAVKLTWSNGTVYDAPTFLGSQGWDFMPQIAGRNVGIYDKVYLTTSGPVTIVDPFVTTTLPLPAISPANVGIQVGLTNATAAAVVGSLVGVIDPIGIMFTQSVTMSPMSFKTVLFTNTIFPQLSIPNPALWWPNGYGPQNLHTLRLSYNWGSTVSDQQDITFGIRQYTYDTNGHELWVSVNGQKVMCKGGNYGMPDAMLKFTDDQMDYAVRLHKEMNFTMIRCWHGNTDFKAFYDACDKYGIMVWDEFWLNGSNYGIVPNDVPMFITNSIDKYKRLRNRACLAVWCAENEAYPPTQLKLRENYQQYDGTRIYIDCSNQGPVHGSGPYEEMEPKWYFATAHGFTTELGSTVVPNVESMREMMPASSLWPPGNTNWVLHNWQYNVSSYTNAVASRYGAVSGIDDFCMKAQFLNVETHKAMFEAWNEKLWNDCGGLLLWMSQQAWPSIVWQTYDWYFDPTGAYFGSKSACEPIHIQWNCNNGNIRVVNNVLEPKRNLIAEVQVYNLDGALKYSSNITGINVAADDTTKCGELFSVNSLSRDCPVTASSFDNTNDLPAFAADGNMGTRWSSAYSDLQWLRVDLGSAKQFNTVTLTWESAYASDFQIQVSNDDATWSTVWSTNKMVLKSSGGTMMATFSPVTARYVRMYGTKRATMWGYSLYEFQVSMETGQNAWLTTLTSTHFIRLRLKDASGNVLSDNFYWRGTDPMNYTALGTLPFLKPSATVGYSVTNKTTFATLTLKNTNSGVLFGLRLKLAKTTGQRILPAVYSDNFFSLLPGESKAVTIEYPTDAASGSPAEVVLSGMNTAEMRAAKAPTEAPRVNVRQEASHVILDWNNGLLLEATNLTGPWVTCNVVAPFTNPMSGSQGFYRVLAQ